MNIRIRAAAASTVVLGLALGFGGGAASAASTAGPLPQPVASETAPGRAYDTVSYQTHVPLLTPKLTIPLEGRP